MARDNFPQFIIEKLRLRVGTRCSNPDCRRPTVAAGNGAEGVNNAGVAAHIYAAAPGGPRYKLDMTPKQRRSIDNGIWLCALCGTMIDRDEDAFPPARLRQWKDDAEKKAREEQGRRLPTAEDAAHQMTMAFAGVPHRYIPMAITNVHRATVEALEQLDPRFRVTSEFSDGRPTIALVPRESVSFSLHVSGRSRDEFESQYKRLVEDAEPARIPAEDLNITGSDLLARIADEAKNGGAFVISPPSRPAVVKLTVPSSASSWASVDEVPGTMYAGVSVLRFEGYGYGGLLHLQIRMRRTEEEGFDANLSLRPDFAKWNGRELLSLPFFDKLELLIAHLENGGRELRLDLEIEGNHVMGATNVSMADSQTLSVWRNYISYVRRARTLARCLHLSLIVNSSAGFSAEDHEALADAIDTLEGQRTYTRAQVNSAPEGTLIVRAEGMQQFDATLSSGHVSDMMLVEQEQKVIRVFGSEVLLPKRRITVTRARPRILRRRHIPEGEELRVKWEMTEESECSYSYATPGSDDNGPPLLAR